MGAAATVRRRARLAASFLAVAAATAALASGSIDGWRVAHPAVVAFLAFAAAVAALQAIEFGDNMHYDAADPIVVLAGMIGGPLGGALAGTATATLYPGGWYSRVGYTAARALQGTLAGAVVAIPDLHFTTTWSALAAAVAAEAAGAAVVFGATGAIAAAGIIDLSRRVVVTNLVDPIVGAPLVAGLALAYAHAGVGPLVLLLVPSLAAATGVRMVRERWRLRHAESEARAQRDPLTGAYNRRWFEEAIAEELDRGGNAGFVLLDLDHFKVVNDEHGHQAGDAVLVEVVRRLSAHVRAGDGVVRWGGEELAVLLRNLADSTDLPARAEDLRRSIGDEPFVVDGVEIHVTASAGAATLAADAASLVAAADAALYDAKRGGRNRAVLV
jgi:diguanylate cyclase (GGDEF)-like protein